MFRLRYLLSIVILGLLADSLLAVEQNPAPPPAERKPNIATMPAQRTDVSDWWIKRHDSISKRVKQGNVDLIFIGDSITKGWEDEGKAVWARHYGKRNAVNLGIGGDGTQHVLWRFQSGNLEGIQPKAAVIMIGSNNSNDQDYTVAEIADGVTAVVRMLRERTPETKILLLGIFPRGAEPNAQRGKIVQVNQILHKLEDRKHVWFLDIGHRFLDGQGNISKDLMPDYVHLSPHGYEVWAKAIEPDLARLLGEK